MPGTRYFGETILVHEFSHAILDAMESADPALFAQVQKAYADAMAKHLWAGQYGATTAHEYWAEGTQSWFNSITLEVIDVKSDLSDAYLDRNAAAPAAAAKAR